MFFHAHLLQNSHNKTEQSFQLLSIWHKFSFQLDGIWYTMSFFIGWYTVNTVDTTLGFFFPALSLTVKLIHSPLGFLALTADFHMQIFSACCKETEEHPHIFTSSSSQFSENWTGHATVTKMGMHVSSRHFPNSLCTKSCVRWLNYNNMFIPSVNFFFIIVLQKSLLGLSLSLDHMIYNKTFFKNYMNLWSKKTPATWNATQTFQSSRVQVNRFILTKYKENNEVHSVFLRLFRVACLFCFLRHLPPKNNNF